MENIENSALICIDFINEMVSNGGKLSGKGYLTFVEENNILKRVKELQDKFRNKNLPVIHVKISFSKNYDEHPRDSPLFGKAKEFKALQENEWGTQFAENVCPKFNEKVIVKRRVSCFYGTDLEITLNALGVKKIYISGVSTDLAVESAAREGHDRDFAVNVIGDCCAAANFNDHSKSLDTLKKIATVKNLVDLI
jgi:nicotinamidase-related amidase